MDNNLAEPAQVLNSVVPATILGLELQAQCNAFVPLLPTAPTIGYLSVPAKINQLHRMIVNEPRNVDTSMLCRSTRSTHYDGFHVAQSSDIKRTISKVKPWKVPAIICASSATAPNSSDNYSAADQASQNTVVPKALPITTIQEIGSKRCGIPHEDLIVENLLANPHNASSSN